MTFFEYSKRSEFTEFQDELEWRRWSQLLSLTYNINRGKGRALTADDFNPYAQLNKKKAPEMTADDIDKLRQEILKRNGRGN